MKRVGLIAGAVVLFAVLTFAGLAAHDKLVVARSNAAENRRITVEALASAEQARKRVDELVAAAAHSDSLRVAAEHRAALTEQKTVKQRAVLAAVEQEDDCNAVCKQLEDAADSVIELQDSTIADLHQALAADSVQRADLKFALDTTRATLTKLQTAAKGLVVADAKLEKASRRPFLLRLLPRPGIGAAAGVGIGGRPDVLTGITLSWTF
jgi:hypothetical protein